MENADRWVRHQTDGSIVWSPLEEDETVKLEGSKPDRDAMEPVDEKSVDNPNILPSADATRIVALAKNRISQDKDPLLFLMTPSSVIGQGDAIQMSQSDNMTWAEVELAAVIDKTADDITESDAPEYIKGYSVANDVTTEPEDGRDWHLAKGKARNTYCPLGPYLATDIDPLNLTMETYVNGELTHSGTTETHKFDIFEAVSYVSEFITLEPGDVVLSGTPPDPFDSEITPGDTTTVSINGIGSLTNPVTESE